MLEPDRAEQKANTAAHTQHLQVSALTLFQLVGGSNAVLVWDAINTVSHYTIFQKFFWVKRTCTQVLMKNQRRA